MLRNVPEHIWAELVSPELMAEQVFNINYNFWGKLEGPYLVTARVNTLCCCIHESQSSRSIVVQIKHQHQRNPQGKEPRKALLPLPSILPTSSILPIHAILPSSPAGLPCRPQRRHNRHHHCLWRKLRWPTFRYCLLLGYQEVDHAEGADHGEEADHDEEADHNEEVDEEDEIDEADELDEVDKIDEIKGPPAAAVSSPNTSSLALPPPPPPAAQRRLHQRSHCIS